MSEDPDVLVLTELYDAWAVATADPAGGRGRLERALDGFADAIDNPQSRHVVDFRADGWTVQHTLACRVRGDLFRCPVNAAAQRLTEPPDELGRYPVDLDGDRLVVDYDTPVNV